MLKRQDYRCNLSGIVLTPQCCELDHKVPLSKGGKHAMDNLQILSPVINGMKGTMDCDQFISMCRLVADHADSEHV